MYCGVWLCWATPCALAVIRPWMRSRSLSWEKALHKLAGTWPTMHPATWCRGCGPFSVWHITFLTMAGTGWGTTTLIVPVIRVVWFCYLRPRSYSVAMVLVWQIPETIFHMVTQAPKLGHRCFKTSSLRKTTLVNFKNKISAIFQDGRHSFQYETVFAPNIVKVMTFAWSVHQNVCFWPGESNSAIKISISLAL